MLPAASNPPRVSPATIVAAGVLLMAGMICSVTLGPQLALWPSAPLLVFLTVACVVVLRVPVQLPTSVLVTGLALVGWMALRCVQSPVASFALTDGILLAACVATFWIFRAILPHRGGVEILFVGLGVLVLASWYPMVEQSKEGGYFLWLPRHAKGYPSGFFTYYGDCAAFLAAMALLSGGLAWDRGRALWFRGFMIVVAIAAAAGVVFTRSRGGIIGLGIGGFVLLVLAPLLSLKRGSRWRGVLAFAVPALLVIGALWIGAGLDQAQEIRKPQDGAGTGNVSGVFENEARLFWLNLAGSCISLHPWQGGGSRSFSWENFRFWETDWAALTAAEPEFVHNEVVQLACDYGLVGLLLMMLLIGAIVVSGAVAQWNSRGRNGAVFVAGLAALTALLVHSCFHFVFHVPPATLLLGLALAAVLEPACRPDAVPPGRSRVWMALVPMACVAFLGWFALKSSLAFRQMAPLLYRFGQAVPSPAEALQRTAEAIRSLPGPVLHLQRGKIALMEAGRAEGPDRGLLLEMAEIEFKEAARLNPLDPEPSVNLANVLSAEGRDREAEDEFQRAIGLQGAAERGFRASTSLSAHHSKKAERLRQMGKLEPALAELIQA
ncbi:MAG: tetratricopeptide repeat protein, partial [Pirellulaceae bacterium]|nr:tetratricopeptide repeat protein [Pirellulaceae bacterium]